MRIDPHVHFRDGEQSYKETIAHGLQLAGEQGVDIVFDMPNTVSPILTLTDVEKRLKLVPETEKHRYYLFVGATGDEQQLTEAVKMVNSVKEVIGIKMFAGKSIGNLQIISGCVQKRVYKTLAGLSYKGVLAVHCEKESFMPHYEFNHRVPFTHTVARPKNAEIESVKDQIRFVQETNFQGTLHICHVSCKESIELINDARRAFPTPMKITCGVTPHHLLWDDSKLLDKTYGLLYKTNPPLRNLHDVFALRDKLKRGLIDWIETDHAPHALGEKLYSGYPSGYPSLYLYKNLVERFLPFRLGLCHEQVVKLTYGNIVKTFGLEL